MNANALGMIETKGLVGAIEAADAMVKAAVDAGAAAAERRGSTFCSCDSTSAYRSGCYFTSS